MDTANQVRVEPSHRCAKRNGCHLWKKKTAHGLLMGSLCAANVCLRPTPLSRGSFWLLCPSLLRISRSLPQALWWSDVQHHEGRLSGLHTVWFQSQLSAALLGLLRGHLVRMWGRREICKHMAAQKINHRVVERLFVSQLKIIGSGVALACLQSVEQVVDYVLQR